ncbi:EAL domain-containing protein [Clostridium sardiniense]|uniref:EAL domain-containing protein n=1 Tax=Clostridium sardiniense TaxID=29369 RepID=A0ABS7L2C3_CLOSR|nr:EAL domain-containing protein [Clostridium sardiniense]MBY0757211.1 EAL domain-containing protein [Clostridium sardiniense]MDQ0462054.1 EAL domain-containing protein (putative c-di-GMP-specific phosphodiesterase class I) [Clostridium sardiniense]
MNKNDIKGMEVVYQPKVDLNTKRIKGVEVLARFFDKNNNMLNTIEVISLAKEFKEMKSLTNIVIDETIKGIKTFKYNNKINFSINISSVEIENDSFKEWIDDLLNRYDIKYLNKLEFEITERHKIENKEEMKKNIHYLKEKGFKVSFDDIGAGYNTFNLIDEYDIDFIKLDKSLVENISKYINLIKNNIKKAHLLNKKVIAEGIEDENTYEILKEINCDLGQGFYFYKPMSLNNLKVII